MSVLLRWGWRLPSYFVRFPGARGTQASGPRRWVIVTVTTLSCPHLCTLQGGGGVLQSWYFAWFVSSVFVFKTTCLNNYLNKCFELTSSSGTAAHFESSLAHFFSLMLVAEVALARDLGPETSFLLFSFCSCP